MLYFLWIEYNRVCINRDLSFVGTMKIIAL